MSFRSMKLTLQGFVPELSAIQLGLRLNNSYQHLLDLNPWSFIKKEYMLSTVAPYTTGTVSITSGTDTVTGVGTVWTADMVGRFFRVFDAFTFHKIASVDVGAQTLTLDQDYGYSDVTTQPYTIFQNLYSYPADCKNLIGIRYDANLCERTKQWIDTLEPDLNSTGQPDFWYKYDDTTIGLWPVPDAVYMLRLYYNRLLPDLAAETDVPEIPERVILAHAILTAYQQLGTTENGAKRYLPMMPEARQNFNDAWSSALEEDMRKLSLPTKVIEDGIDFPQSNDYWMRHDPTDPRGSWR